MRGITVYWGIFRHYWGILSHIQTFSELCVTLGYSVVLIQNLGIFIELKASSKACRTCHMIRHIYSSISEDIYGYLWILMHIHPPTGIIPFAKCSILIVWQRFEYASISITTHYAMYCIRHIQNSGTFEILFIQAYFIIFNIIKAYSRILRHY